MKIPKKSQVLITHNFKQCKADKFWQHGFWHMESTWRMHMEHMESDNLYFVATLLYYLKIQKPMRLFLIFNIWMQKCLDRPKKI